MTYENIITETKERIVIITVNRPAKKNALNLQTYREINSELKRADEDQNIRVIIFTGSEQSFTSGNDLKDFMNIGSSDDNPILDFLYTLKNVKKPVIAAVNGLAVGVGVTLLAHCDLVVAADNAEFLAPFVNIGLVPEYGSTLLFPSMMGKLKANEIFLLGEKFSVQKAYEYNLINYIVPQTHVVQKAVEIAQKISLKPPGAMRATKKLMNEAMKNTIEEVMQEELKTFFEGLQSEEFQEAMAAFFEKRDPDFSKFS